MPRVVIRGPDGTVEHTLELATSGAVLVGRAPVVESAPRESIADRNVDVKVVPDGAVSSNHALVWSSDDGGVRVRDLASRNGTWLLVPRGEGLRVDADEVVLHLARPLTEPRTGDEPRTPTWSTRREFVWGLSEAIEHWMRTQGVEVTISVISADDPEEPLPTRLPLATGDALEITPIGTADSSWSRLLERVCAWTVAQNAVFRAEEETKHEGMILASRAIRAAHRDVVEAAKSGTGTMLLAGPSGVGKEKLAHVFHRNTGRQGPFVAVNCSMFSKELLRSELFGAEAGSFTGATKRIRGAVERAQGGTLFLDEIGEMPVDLQPMLLRFLDRREYEHLGRYGEVQRADVRIVAATNRDLRAAARAGTFRTDLWYRLSVHVVDVPPLRLRWEDIIAFLDSVPAGGQHTMRAALSPDAIEVLRSHGWEGNFREMTNFVARLPRSAPPGSIDAASCREALERGSLQPVMSAQARLDASSRTDWASLVARSIDAFVEDNGREPESWDDQKEWNEKYLKPLVFSHLSGAASAPRPADSNGMSLIANQAAARLQADRGTAAKQLARFFERFRP